MTLWILSELRAHRCLTRPPLNSGVSRPSPVTEKNRVLAEISSRAKVGLRAASPVSLSRLDALGFPNSVRSFYAQHEPSACAEIENVRLWPADEVARENTEFVPGADLHPRGYAVFATTVFGDAYCLDLNGQERSGLIPIVLMSHELGWAQMDADEIRRLRKVVARSFEHWLELFAQGRLDIEPLYEPPS